MTPILTVTLNPALDKIGSAETYSTFPGGKGVNVSRALKALDIESEALVAISGRNGHALVKGMKAEGLSPIVFEVSGETRVNTTHVPLQGGELARDMQPGPKWSAVQAKRLMKSFPAIVRGRAVVIFSGSLPPGVPPLTYRELIRLAHKEGAATVLDTSGAAFRQGIKAKPFVIKPNRAEAEEFLKMTIASPEEIKKALASFLDEGMKMVLLTFADQGLAATDGKEFWHITTQRFKGHGVGCGDAALAGFLAAMVKARPFVDQVRLAAVAGAANVLGEVPGGISQEAISRSVVGIKVEKL